MNEIREEIKWSVVYFQGWWFIFCLWLEEEPFNIFLTGELYLSFSSGYRTIIPLKRVVSGQSACEKPEGFLFQPNVPPSDFAHKHTSTRWGRNQLVKPAAEIFGGTENLQHVEGLRTGHPRLSGIIAYDSLPQGKEDIYWSLMCYINVWKLSGLLK